MDIRAVQTTYARWAPVYDKTFGAVTNVGRRRAVGHVNARGGSVLEVGVGTGLSLKHYAANTTVTGIDFSAEMLTKARRKVAEKRLTQVQDLHQMDARQLDFPDNHFGTVVAMHIMSVVPEPERVMSEMARVCKPGGQIVMVNHFAREKGLLAALEKVSARWPDLLGWHSDFDKSRVMDTDGLHLIEQTTLPPAGMMTFLVFEKIAPS